MNIALASDHAGFAYKEMIKSFLVTQGHNVKDFGTSSEDPVDYPIYIRPAAEAVASGIVSAVLYSAVPETVKQWLRTRFEGFAVRSAGVNRQHDGPDSITTRMSFPSASELSIPEPLS